MTQENKIKEQTDRLKIVYLLLPNIRSDGIKYFREHQAGNYNKPKDMTQFIKTISQ